MGQEVSALDDSDQTLGTSGDESLSPHDFTVASNSLKEPSQRGTAPSQSSHGVSMVQELLHREFLQFGMGKHQLNKNGFRALIRSLCTASVTRQQHRAAERAGVTMENLSNVPWTLLEKKDEDVIEFAEFWNFLTGADTRRPLTDFLFVEQIDSYDIVNITVAHQATYHLLESVVREEVLERQLDQRVAMWREFEETLRLIYRSYCAEHILAVQALQRKQYEVDRKKALEKAAALSGSTSTSTSSRGTDGPNSTHGLDSPAPAPVAKSTPVASPHVVPLSEAILRVGEMPVGEAHHDDPSSSSATPQPGMTPLPTRKTPHRGDSVSLGADETSDQRPSVLHPGGAGGAFTMDQLTARLASVQQERAREKAAGLQASSSMDSEHKAELEEMFENELQTQAEQQDQPKSPGTPKAEAVKGKLVTTDAVAALAAGASSRIVVSRPDNGGNSKEVEPGPETVVLSSDPLFKHASELVSLSDSEWDDDELHSALGTRPQSPKSALDASSDTGGGSDTDEFFDAEELTPRREQLRGDTPTASPIKDMPLSESADEKRAEAGQTRSFETAAIVAAGTEAIEQATRVLSLHSLPTATHEVLGEDNVVQELDEAGVPVVLAPQHLSEERGEQKETKEVEEVKVDSTYFVSASTVQSLLAGHTGTASTQSDTDGTDDALLQTGITGETNWNDTADLSVTVPSRPSNMPFIIMGMPFHVFCRFVLEDLREALQNTPLPRASTRVNEQQASAFSKLHDLYAPAGAAPHATPGSDIDALLLKHRRYDPSQPLSLHHRIIVERFLDIAKRHPVERREARAAATSLAFGPSLFFSTAIAGPPPESKAVLKSGSAESVEASVHSDLSQSRLETVVLSEDEFVGLLMHPSGPLVAPISVDFIETTKIGMEAFLLRDPVLTALVKAMGKDSINNLSFVDGQYTLSRQCRTCQPQQCLVM